MTLKEKKDDLNLQMKQHEDELSAQDEHFVNESTKIQTKDVCQVRMREEETDQIYSAANI